MSIAGTWFSNEYSCFGYFIRDRRYIETNFMMLVMLNDKRS